MRLDALVRLIETADFSSFRELAAHCLALKGYREVTVTDGWNDGGADVRVFQLPPNPTAMAFQITVERDWKGKLHDDVAKVKARLGLRDMTLVASRRIPEAEFFIESENVWREHGVRVTKLDGQAIASTFFLEGRTSLVLRLLGIDVAESARTATRSSVRADAAYALMFFSREAHYFKEAAIEAAVLAVAAKRRSTPKSDLEREVETLLTLPEGHRGLVSSAVDRMIQRSDLLGPASALTLSPPLADAAGAMLALREKDWSDLERAVGGMLADAGIKPRRERVEQIIEHLGALLLEAVQNALGALQSQEVSVMPRVKRRLRQMHATLDSMGMPEGVNRERFLENLVRLGVGSTIGKSLLAGELFLSMTPLSTPHLIRALGARSEIQTLLDASVAIPMLAGLLFRPVDNRFSVAAHHAYTQLRSHGLPLSLPVDYLEEAAAHLLRAYHDYAEIIDLDEDLTASENSYVAHYAAQRAAGETTSFVDYVEAFGLDESLIKADFYVALQALKPRLQRLFDRYSVSVMPLGNPSSASQLRAEEAIAYAFHELDQHRPEVTARHDARTLAFLFDTDRTSEAAYVLCTWDGVHFKARSRESAQWLALNPALLGDILTMAASEDLGGPIASPVVLAKSLSEEAAEAGARIWDQLVQIERGNLRDAALLRVAQQFKNEYIQDRQAGRESEAIRKAWATWKSRNYSAKTPGDATADPNAPEGGAGV